MEQTTTNDKKFQHQSNN